MKNVEKITVVLRDARGNPHPTKIYINSKVEIDVLADNMVMRRPRQYDTNKEDRNKSYYSLEMMEFVATKEFVAKFNQCKNSDEAIQLCHDEYMKAMLASGEAKIVNIL